MSFDICIFTHHELHMMCDYTYVFVFCSSSRLTCLPTSSWSTLEHPFVCHMAGSVIWSPRSFRPQNLIPQEWRVGIRGLWPHKCRNQCMWCWVHMLEPMQVCTNSEPPVYHEVLSCSKCFTGLRQLISFAASGFDGSISEHPETLPGDAALWEWNSVISPRTSRGVCFLLSYPPWKYDKIWRGCGQALMHSIENQLMIGNEYSQFVTFEQERVSRQSWNSEVVMLYILYWYIRKIR